MADFPTTYTQIADGYSIEADYGVTVTYAQSGKMRHNVGYSDVPYDISFRLAPVTVDGVKALKQFASSYKFEEINWTDQFTDEVYTVQILNDPQVVRVYGRVAVVEVVMRGVKQ